MRHKLLIRRLAGDLHRRRLQIGYYRAHLDSQYLDRERYYRERAKSRLRGTQEDGLIHVCLIIDGMDQAKFCCPRSEAVHNSKEFETPRPRLHVSAIICHGHFRMVFVADPDTPKDGNYTIECLAHALTRLHAMRVDLAKVRWHVQADNTCRETKNNWVFRWLAILTCMFGFDSCNLEFLRPGHTHEDIDQFFGSMGTFLLKSSDLQDPEAFVRRINVFLQTTNQGTESWCLALKVDQVRNWKSWLVHLPALG